MTQIILDKVSGMKDQRDPKSYAIIGAAMEVHRQLGPGFLEAVYQDALEIEFRLRNIPYKREGILPIFYKGQKLSKFYRVDFVCCDSFMVELKALAKLSPVETAIIINYLNISDLNIGLLLNFGSRSLEYPRFANSRNKSYKSAQSADR